jgi:hypothetical protein
VKRFRAQAPEVPSRVGVLEVGLRVSLLAVDEIREFDWVLDKEDWSVVANHVVVAFFSVEFNGESSRISLGIGSTLLACDGGESEKDWSSLSYLVEELCLNEPKEE